MNHKQKSVVLPGEVLCTSEEYISSEGTYIDEGYVKSNVVGTVMIDKSNKSISVTASNIPKVVKVGDVVIGYVTEVKSQKAFVLVKHALNNNRELITSYKGYIHISKALDDYVSSMHYLFNIGDIVKAKVVSKYGVEYLELATNEDELGVIKAMCVNCRKYMKLTPDNKLVCDCGKIDSRKLSNKYGGL